ncbi:hypothetical protein I3760_07G052100 [Carya illinoinensis]|uniref:Secreted protein n=1 Tax=Carya illinoinensis TaxID=32201 RepID=A0A922EH19_CARIL|nr:hypothetical protein I3760_07G052100 [Carya illinoinensis]KAG6702805.1 hypothetical protein I3842_07G054000 [Carya illinoinensis]
MIQTKNLLLFLFFIYGGAPLKESVSVSMNFTRTFQYSCAIFSITLVRSITTNIPATDHSPSTQPPSCISPMKP